MIWYNALFSFSGRLNRQGFWLGFIINFIFLFIFTIFINPISQLFFIFLPLWLTCFSLSSVIVKRLHDRNRSGKALFMVLIPILCYYVSTMAEGTMQFLLGTAMPAFIGAVLFLEWGVFAGNPEPNQYGEKGLSFKFRE